MLKITADRKPPILTLKIVGEVTEQEQLTPHFAAPEALLKDGITQVVLNLRGLSRINSVGVRWFSLHLVKFRNSGVQLALRECSPVFVSVLSLYLGAANSGLVESLCLPYLCGACKMEFESVVTLAQARAMYPRFPTLFCTKCGGYAQFDEVAEEYLAFLAVKP